MINKKSLLFLFSGIIIYAILSLLIWQERYFYDDELINLKIITSYDYAGLLNFLSGFDFHPPGQYLINKLIYNITGPNEWLMSLPSVICTGLTAGLAGLITFKITKAFWVGFAALSLASVSPLLLMWGWSIRWYPYWIFITFLSFFILLKIPGGNSKRNLYYVLLVLLFTAGLYISYLSLLFFAAVFFTSLVTDLKNRNFSGERLISLSTYKVSIIILISFILFSPWLLNFGVHFKGYFAGQQISNHIMSINPVAVTGYSLFSGLFGSSIYPWNTVFIILFTGLIISFFIALYFLLREKRNALHIKEKNNTCFNSVIIFSVICLILLVVLSLVTKSLKSQPLLLMPVLLSVILTISGYYLIRKLKAPDIHRKVKTGYSYLLLSLIFFVCIWIAGAVNIFNRQHFHKMGLSDPVSQVLNVINRNAGGELLIVMTTNPVISYYLTKEMNDKIIVIAPKGYYQFAPSTAGEEMGRAEILFLETYLGSLIPVSDEYYKIVNYLRREGIPSGEPLYLGRDEDFRMKKEITSVPYLPEYRFVLHYYKPKDAWNTEKLFQLSKLSVY